MQKKTLSMTVLALMIGALIGGFTLTGIQADEVAEDKEIPTCEQRCQRHQEMLQLKENIDREVQKVDDGIQINLRGQDEETIGEMHELYDENGGNWGMFGPKGMKMGKGAFHENCPYAE